MDLSRRLLFLPLTIFLASGIPDDASKASATQTGGEEILDRVKRALWDPSGRQFTIQWHYTLGEDVWKGDGVLKILGRDYLMLTLPGQEILIKKSTVMSWFRETDQLIIDEFDRRDPGNILSVLLGELTQFSVIQSRPASDSTILLRLKNETLSGFDELDMSVDKREWTPVSIRARAGDDVTVSIEVVDSAPLGSREELVNASLSGEDIIDLRE